MNEGKRPGLVKKSGAQSVRSFSGELGVLTEALLLTGRALVLQAVSTGRFLYRYKDVSISLWSLPFLSQQAGGCLSAVINFDSEGEKRLDWLQWLLSFIGVLGLIFFLFYALKKLNKGISVKSGSRLRVLDRVNIGREGMLLIVSVCGRVMLLGVTAQKVDKLCDLDISEDEYLSMEQTPDFKSVLASAFFKKQERSTDEKEKRQGDRADEDAFDEGDTTE